MGISIQGGQRAAQRGTAPKISLIALFRELSCLRRLCKHARLSEQFGAIAGMETNCDILERKYYALQKNASMALTL